MEWFWLPRPIVALQAGASRIGSGELDQRVEIRTGDELETLADTFNQMTERLGASRAELEHQNELLRESERLKSELISIVSPELRTPLAGIRGRAELALGARGAEADAEREAALRAIVAHADNLDRTIDALLVLARRELDPTAGAVDLAAVAAEFPDVEVAVQDGLPRAEGDCTVMLSTMCGASL